MSKATRLDRCIAEAVQAFGNLLGALADELELAKSTVAPHNHPPVMIRIDAAPEPEAPAAGPGRKIVTWTPDRMDVLKRDYPAGVSLDVIHQRINALPADRQIKRRDIAIKAARHGWNRPPVQIPESAETQASVTAPGSDGTLDQPDGPTKVIEQIVSDRSSDLPAPPSPAPAKIEAPKVQSIVLRSPASASSKTPSARSQPSELERWSIERLDVAQPAFEEGATISMIVASVNALPGPPVTGMHVNVVAAARGWKRGIAAAQGAPPAAAASVEANFDQIRQWAGDRGIMVQGRTLPIQEINARRLRLGMPSFVLTPTARGRVA